MRCAYFHWLVSRIDYANGAHAIFGFDHASSDVHSWFGFLCTYYSGFISIRNCSDDRLAAWF